jgi:predicted nucleic acid-binding protein
MIRDGVIVDTSVLIAFFKGRNGYVEEVSRLLQENRLVLTGIIIAELLQGLKGLREEQRISDLLLAITPFELTTELWVKAGKMSLSLKRKGINLPLTDMAIAVLAIEHDFSIFTLDKHFEKIPGVKIYKI